MTRLACALTCQHREPAALSVMGRSVVNGERDPEHSRDSRASGDERNPDSLTPLRLSMDAMPLHAAAIREHHPDRGILGKTTERP